MHKYFAYRYQIVLSEDLALLHFAVPLAKIIIRQKANVPNVRL